MGLRAQESAGKNHGLLFLRPKISLTSALLLLARLSITRRVGTVHFGSYSNTCKNIDLSIATSLKS